MSTRREMRSGIADLTGQRRGSLLIESIAQRNPVKWRVRCTDPTCNLQTVIDHSRLQSGAVKDCPNQHGQTTVRRSGLATTVNASPAVRSRDSESARHFHAEEAELEHEQQQAAEEQAAVERTQKAEATRQKQRAFIAESIATGPDPLFPGVDPDTLQGRISVPVSKVEEWNQAEVYKFKRACPDYYPCAENLAALTGYLERNSPGLALVSAKQLEAAYRRLQSLGLLKERPAAPVVHSEPAKRPVTEANLTVAPSQDGPDGIVDGWALDGLSRRQWTRRELDRLGADDYRRALKLGSLSVARHLGKPGADRVLIAAGKELL
jgi:hypothetical protein